MGGRRYTLKEDRVIRKYAGVKSAEEIGMMIDRPRHGIHNRIRKLGLSGHLHGEHHWAAKVDGLRLSMIHTLLDAGFTPSEIHRMFRTPLDITYNYITQLACMKHRKRG